MKVGIGNDHAAVELKMQIKEFIESMGHGGYRRKL